MLGRTYNTRHICWNTQPRFPPPSMLISKLLEVVRNFSNNTELGGVGRRRDKLPSCNTTILDHSCNMFQRNVSSIVGHCNNKSLKECSSLDFFRLWRNFFTRFLICNNHIYLIKTFPHIIQNHSSLVGIFKHEPSVKLTKKKKSLKDILVHVHVKMPSNKPTILNNTRSQFHTLDKVPQPKKPGNYLLAHKQCFCWTYWIMLTQT